MVNRKEDYRPDPSFHGHPEEGTGRLFVLPTFPVPGGDK